MRHVTLSAVAALWLTVGFASANVMAETSGRPELRKLNIPGSQVQAIATRLSIRYREVPGITISPDAPNHQLVVMAPASAQQQIAADVQTLLSSSTVRQASALGPVKVQLHHRSWAQFEDDLKQIAGTPLPITTSRNGERASFQLHATPLQGTTVEVDRRNNQVTVTAPNSAQAGWREVIETIDSPAKRQSDVMRLFRFENAEAAPVQRAIRILADLEANGSANGHLTPVDANNSLTNALFQQDAAAGNSTPAPQASTVPNIEGEVTEEVTIGGSGVIGDTQIQFVPELGTIIIRGAKRDVQRVMDVIKEIEKQSEVTRPDIEVVELQHADSNAVATLLAQLYSDVLSARQGEVSITALDAPNALLLIGRTEAINNVRDLIAKVDQPIDSASRLRIFRLKHASASDAEETIRGFFTVRPGEDDELRPALGTRVRILADYRTNSLIVAAAPRDMSEVIRLINELDVQNVSAKSEIKIFPLNNAIAEDLAPIIQEAISGESDFDGDGNITPPSSSVSIVALDAEGGRVLDSGILAGSVVTADPGANSIVVRAPANSMALIAELISQLDRAPGIDSLVKVFTIENGDATQLTAALEQLFGTEAATSGTSVGAGNLGGLPSTTSGSESSLVPLRFSTDLRTNSIIASGSGDDLEVVESILLRLDTEGFSERITEVIWLRHQNAENIAAAIQDYVSQRSTRLNTIQQFQQGGLGPFDLPDRDLIVVAEPVSNSLLLSVSPRLYEDVRRLIDKLDRRPPMVLIKVLLAEVRLGDFFEIGGEVGLQDSMMFDRGVASGAIPGAGASSDPGFLFNGNGTPNVNSFGQENVAGRGLSSFGVGASNGSLGYGGFVLSAASESVSLLLRTLQDSERLQILSRPQIMTMDNTEGFVQVGRQIARVTGVINNGISGTQVVTEDIEVGLIMNVRPRVGADGLIVMDIDATRSARDENSGTTIPTGDGGTVTIDDILRTTAQSTVASYSGQTVIFGGLIQKVRTNQSRRVPYLADIPLLGYFFKYDREFEERSELLIVMTPMLVTGEEDLEYVKTVESSRMSWCLADVVEMHGDVGLSGGYGLWGPTTGGTIYPDLQPTVDQFETSTYPEDAYAPEYSAPSVILNDSNSSVPSGAIDAGVMNRPSGTVPSSQPYHEYQDNGMYTAPSSSGIPVPAEASGQRMNPFPNGSSSQGSGELLAPPVQNPNPLDQSNAAKPSALSQATWQEVIQKPKSAAPVRLGASGN
ncbi:Type II secretion system protein D precursor [Novipirellula aureliae]|uniref:Type II secretion system protein D n=1 Tax=Novipirellula aureliae TaxID=2527966 RepID=A0A5C6DUG2_9BACT|nr:secretin N-terminal domain-containing protein [Novipirellula aureliae]TWU39894.1 Type II secretion system protein D precursor [Novipirellula aureliae]